MNLLKRIGYCLPVIAFGMANLSCKTAQENAAVYVAEEDNSNSEVR